MALQTDLIILMFIFLHFLMFFFLLYFIINSKLVKNQKEKETIL